MQAIILAAGKGTRMRPLTDNTPKPLLKVGGLNLIERNLANLTEEVDELVIVVGYLAEQIESYFGENFKGRDVTYVRQEEPLGTAHALSLCGKHITGRFMILMGDDLYSREDLEECLKHERAWLVKKVQGDFAGGLLVRDALGNVTDVVEGKHSVKEAFVNVNMFVLTPEYFQYDYKEATYTTHSGTTEYSLPHLVTKMAKDYPIKMIEAQDWQQMTTPSDLENLNKKL